MCYVFLFMIHVFICGTLRWISVLAVVALLSAVLAKNGFGFYFSLCGSDGGIDMITYSVLAQSFLTSILRVGVWIISRLFSLTWLLEYEAR